MAHSFEVDVAVKYGVNAAVLLNNIYFWCEKNRANNHNFRDGSYWTYNSRSAFVQLFPYLSERQIKTALDKLIEDGVIKTGCYNEMGRDRTMWYALTEKGLSMMQKCSVQTAEMSNANCENVRPLPDIKPTDIKQTDIYIVGFDDFWKVYPRHEARKDAIKAWKSIKPDDALLSTIVADIKKRLADGGSWYKSERKFIPLPAAYLRGERWEDEPSGGTTDEVKNPDEPWWKSKPWWEWPIEEQRKLEQQVEERERAERERNGG
jgi:hypothetical protein